MEQQQEVQTIFFKDLFFAAFYQWKKILIAAVVFGLFLGGFQFAKNRKADSMPPNPEAQAQLTEAQKLYDATQVAIQAHNTYLADSLLMNLDPTQVCTAGADIYAVTEQIANTPDKSLAVLRAYEAFIRNDTLLTTPAGTLGHNSGALSELIVTKILGENATPTLSITVMYSNEEGAQLLLDTLLQGLHNATDGISKNIASHTISISTYARSTGANWLLVEAQTAAHQRTEQLNTLLKARTTTLNNAKGAVPQSGKSPILLAIVGAVLGAALVVCCAWAFHIGSSRIYSARVLKARTGVKVLGCIPHTKYRGIDAWLRKLEGRAVNAESAAITAATIRNYTAGATHVLLTGDGAAEIADSIRTVLNNTGTQISVGGNLTEDVQALHLLPQCDAVILAETCNRSTYTQAEKALELINDHGKDTLGCVLLDG